MKIRDFQLERYFAEYEFSVAHLLSPSDCETWTVEEILALGGAALEDLKSLRLSYTESRGGPALLDAIGEYHAQNGAAGLGRECCVTGCPEELIFLFLNSFLEAGDRVVSIFPAYQSLYELPRAIGCEVIFLPLTASGGRWVWDLGRLESLLRPRTKLLIVNFPHNPTGYMPSPEEFAHIEELCARNGVTVFSDEMYRGLELDGPALPVFGGRENAVSLCGVSKGLGLPGLRLGWLASRRRGLTDAALALKDYTTICGPAPSEFLAGLALRGSEPMLSRNRDILRANANLAVRFFANRTDAVEWIGPMGGPTAFPRLLRGGVAELCRRAAEEKSLMILPDRVFDVDENRFRVGLGRKNFPQALEVFGEMLEDMGSGRHLTC